MKNEDRAVQIVSHFFLFVFSLLCLLPFILLVSASLTSDKYIGMYGYSFFPGEWSLDAYRYLLLNWKMIGRAYLTSIGITAAGVVLSLFLTATLSYPLSRRDLPHRGKFNFYVVFTMLFNGGLVPTYLIYTELFHIKNTYWALLIPTLLLNGFSVMIMRTYFSSSVPPELIDAAKIDGCGEVRAFFRIVLPTSLPILATVGLLSGLAYWNDWYNGLIFLTSQKYYNLQNVLNRIMSDIQALRSISTGATQINGGNMPIDTVRMAIAAIAVLPIMIAFPFFQKYFIKGITLGAVKG